MAADRINLPTLSDRPGAALAALAGQLLDQPIAPDRPGEIATEIGVALAPVGNEIPTTLYAGTLMVAANPFPVSVNVML